MRSVKNLFVFRNTKKTNAMEIENQLHKCPEIIEACVKGKPNKSDYDAVHAFICTEDRKAVEEFIKTSIPEVYEIQPHYYDQRRGSKFNSNLD